MINEESAAKNVAAEGAENEQQQQQLHRQFQINYVPKSPSSSSSAPQLSSDIDIVSGSQGITLYCAKRFRMPRFVPFDVKGRCKQCRGEDMDLEYLIDPTGITISCSRMRKEKYVPFDNKSTFNSGSSNAEGVIHIKSRRKRFTLPLERFSPNINNNYRKTTNGNAAIKVQQQLQQDYGNNGAATAPHNPLAAEKQINSSNKNNTTNNGAHDVDDDDDDQRKDVRKDAEKENLIDQAIKNFLEEFPQD